MPLVIVLALAAFVFLCVQAAYSLRWGDSFANPIIKYCYVVETNHKNSNGIGLLSVPKFELLPHTVGKIVFEQENCTLIKAKLEGLKLKLKNPSKKYNVCFHY